MIEKKKGKFQRAVSDCTSITGSLVTRLFFFFCFFSFSAMWKRSGFPHSCATMVWQRGREKKKKKKRKDFQGETKKESRKERKNRSMTPTFLDIRITAASGILSLKASPQRDATNNQREFPPSQAKKNSESSQTPPPPSHPVNDSIRYDTYLYCPRVPPNHAAEQ